MTVARVGHSSPHKPPVHLLARPRYIITVNYKVFGNTIIMLLELITGINIFFILSTI